MPKKPMKNFHIKHFFINKQLRMMLVIAFCLLLILNSFLIYRTVTSQKYTYKDIQAYNYSHNANVRYSVKLLPNPIFSKKNLEQGISYIPQLIDYIDTYFKYEFEGDYPVNINGNYEVLAYLESSISNESGSESLWKKKYIIQPMKKFDGKNNRILLNNKIPISLKSYQNFITMAYSELKFNFSSKLTIVWNVSIDAKTDKGTITETLSPKMVIPLGGQLIKISGKLNDQNSNALKETIKIISPDFTSKVIIYSATEGLVLIGFLVLLILTKSKQQSSLHLKKLKHIFKTHGDRLVVISNDISFNNKEIINLYSLDDLIKLSDDLVKPIIYRHDADPNLITKFYVIDKTCIYIYDLEEETSKPTPSNSDPISETQLEV